MVLIDCGIVKTKRTASLAEKLKTIHAGLSGAITQCEPAAMAVEDIFFAKHPNAALKLGHARGVALLCASSVDLEVFEYAPTVVKRTLVGRGQADKNQVAQLVARVLGMKEPPKADAADALAVAITHQLAARSTQAQLRGRA